MAFGKIKYILDLSFRSKTRPNFSVLFVTCKKFHLINKSLKNSNGIFCENHSATTSHQVRVSRDYAKYIIIMRRKCHFGYKNIQSWIKVKNITKSLHNINNIYIDNYIFYKSKILYRYYD